MDIVAGIDDSQRWASRSKNRVAGVTETDVRGGEGVEALEAPFHTFNSTISWVAWLAVC